MILFKMIFINDIMHRNGGVMSHTQLSKIYGNICSIQMYNQLTAELPQKNGGDKWKKEKVGNLFVPIPWHMVDEPVQKTALDSTLRVVLLKRLYQILATNRMLQLKSEVDIHLG